MKAATLGILLGAAMLPALAQTTDDNGPDEHVHVEFHCSTTPGKCPPPPEPPAPPAPPAAPVPPAPPAADAGERGVPPAMPPLPAVPALASIPAPPPPPKVPPVPAEAHAACATRPAGSALTWNLGEGEVMKGVCAKRNGRMVFVLRSHELNG
ncbi:MAG: hypothetical protein JF619_08575 [Massilia sp.]|nr:hypothetical protein [Massilia sp.]